MNQQEFFERILAELESLRIPYMVAGSVGAMIYGEPRLTNDMDLVVSIEIDRVADFLAAFDSTDVYLPPREAVEQAIRDRRAFNAVHAKSGSKADLIVQKDTPFAREEFRRRKRVPFSASRECYSATAEDIIVAKLIAFREGGSDKHIRDIRGILSVSKADLDRAYVERWVAALGLAKEWAAVETSGGGNEKRVE